MAIRAKVDRRCDPGLVESPPKQKPIILVILGDDDH